MAWSTRHGEAEHTTNSAERCGAPVLTRVIAQPLSDTPSAAAWVNSPQTIFPLPYSIPVYPHREHDRGQNHWIMLCIQNNRIYYMPH